MSTPRLSMAKRPVVKRFLPVITGIPGSFSARRHGSSPASVAFSKISVEFDTTLIAAVADPL